MKGLGVAILSSALPFFTGNDGLEKKKLPAKTFSILMSTEPAFAALSGLVFLAEELSFTVDFYCLRDYSEYWNNYF